MATRIRRMPSASRPYMSPIEIRSAGAMPLRAVVGTIRHDPVRRPVRSRLSPSSASTPSTSTTRARSLRPTWSSSGRPSTAARRTAPARGSGRWRSVRPATSPHDGSRPHMALRVDALQDLAVRRRRRCRDAPRRDRARARRTRGGRVRRGRGRGDAARAGRRPLDRAARRDRASRDTSASGRCR